MDRRAKEYLRTNVTRKATKKKSVFQIANFQYFLNKELLPCWKVKPWARVSSLVKGGDLELKFLQAREACVLACPHKLGMFYTTKTKCITLMSTTGNIYLHITKSG